MEEVAISTNSVRDLMLTSFIDSNETEVIEHIILNMLPINKMDDKHVISDFSDYIDLDGVLPYFKKDIPKQIKNFLNIVLTNTINRTLTMTINGLSIDSFLEDRAGLIELARDDEDVAKVLNRIDYVSMFKHIDNKDDIAEMYDVNENITHLVVKHIVKMFIVPTDVLGGYSYLEKGGIFRLTKNLKIYQYIIKYLSEILDGDNEYVIYTEDGRCYLLTNSIYGYMTIKKFNVDDYQALNI